MNEWEKKNILVVGLGESGYASADVLGGLGARVTVVDSSERPLRADGITRLQRKGVEVRLSCLVPEDTGSFDLIVASPGVPDGAPVFKAARDSGIKVISELELGFRLLENRMCAVAGTNGKTTTTSSVAAMVDGPKGRGVACGNIGNPLVGNYGVVGRDDILVVEVSSFQLRNIDKFKAEVSIVLNIAPDHFDWHGGMKEYRAAKMRLIENIGENDFLIYNLENEFCRMMADRSPGKNVGFAEHHLDGAGVWVEGGWIMAGPPLHDEIKVVPMDEIKLKGRHNTENLMAAVGAALALGADIDGIRRAAVEIEALEHRMEYAGEVDGVAFVNDSKATNPHAAMKAIESLDVPTVVIMGGKNKGLSFDELGVEICERMGDGTLRGVVLFGESGDELKESVLRACPNAKDRLQMADDLDDSVQKALERLNGAGSILLSPACASFDMFDDYGHRGREFKKIVLRMKGGV